MEDSMPAEPEAPTRQPAAAAAAAAAKQDESPRAGRPWIRKAWMGSALLALLLAVGTRIYNVFMYPGLTDFDGPGHALNVVSLHGGVLPPPTSWSGFHPPLYHSISALLWYLIPPAMPVHVGMRFLSLAAGFGAVYVAWKALRRLTNDIDAALIATLILGIPVFAIATSMLGNETACVLFVTLLYARLLDIPEDPKQLWRHILVSSAIGALAMLSKSTGWVAVGLGAFAYLAHGLLRGPRDLRRALLTSFVFGAIPLLVAGPFYLRVGLAGGGSPLSFISGAALSPDLALVMSKQPPGERILQDYLNVPMATFLDPRFDKEGMMHSVPGLLYAGIWADGQGHFVWLTENARNVARILTVGGLLPTAVALLGAVQIVRRRKVGEIACLVLGVVLLISLLRYSWMFPRFSAVKGSYLLPALLPGGLVLAMGMQALPRFGRPIMRLVLLALSIVGSGFTLYGWWWWVE